MGQRWVARRSGANALRAAILVAPIAGGALAVLGTVTAADRQVGAVGAIGLFGLFLAVAFVVDVVVRRLQPLVGLLRIELTFPHEAPSRLRVAWKAAQRRRLPAELRHMSVMAGWPDMRVSATEEILVLVAAIDAWGRRRGHARRVHELSLLIAAELGLSDDDTQKLAMAALVHDLGEAAVDPLVVGDELALGREDAQERHPIDGGYLISPLRLWLGPWAGACEQHHEHYDGSGVPFGLAGDVITLSARIVAVADEIDMVTARMADAAGAPLSVARYQLHEAGLRFDPAVVAAADRIPDEAIRRVVGGRTPWRARPVPATPTRVSRAPVLAPVWAARGVAAVIIAALAAVASTPAAVDPPGRTEPKAVVAGEQFERPAGNAPVAGPDNATTIAGRPVVVDVVGNDEDPDGDLDPATLKVIGVPEADFGSASATVDGGAIVVATDRKTGPLVTVGYEVCDRSGRCSEGHLAVTVL